MKDITCGIFPGFPWQSASQDLQNFPISILPPAYFQDSWFRSKNFFSFGYIDRQCLWNYFWKRFFKEYEHPTATLIHADNSQLPWATRPMPCQWFKTSPGERNHVISPYYRGDGNPCPESGGYFRVKRNQQGAGAGSTIKPGRHHCQVRPGSYIKLKTL